MGACVRFDLDQEIAAAVKRLHESIDRRVAQALAKQRPKNPRRVMGQIVRRLNRAQ